MSKVGEWIEGPFLNATIRGFIIDEVNNEYKLVVKDIESFDNTEIPSLTYGSVQSLPKEVIDVFYISFNREQQASLIEQSSKSSDMEWYNESLHKFINPFKEVIEHNRRVFKERTNVELVYSKALELMVELEQESKEKLFKFYQEAVEKGITPVVKSPSDINNSDALDNTIASIVYVSKNPEGIDFIKTLIRSE